MDICFSDGKVLDMKYRSMMCQDLSKWHQINFGNESSGNQNQFDAILIGPHYVFENYPKYKELPGQLLFLQQFWKFS